ncbi:MAG TPA: bifunctional [glutamine synthetase] adenylyltransferase/[glutamine synthetase]-adenylyl-L-tyrosine phosphorylase, partial [Rhizobiales bacterium]|nr:bifunctional [glutamine synthetase] adenylyltransferase/[glutamine synthetase]-adenylyl-L-tyrosine phosphorylase [Hyphomicrobiales bacterium]
MMNRSLIASLKALPEPPDISAAAEKCRDLFAAEGGGALHELARSHPPVQSLLLELASASPYLFALISRNLEFTCQCLTQNPESLMQEIRQQTGKDLRDLADETGVQSILRRAKARAALLVALGDISGYWPVLEAARQLSEMADWLVQEAVRWLIGQEARAGNLVLRTPGDPALSCGYTVLALGKLGAGELNYSSDIDLIVLYAPETAPLGEGADAAKTFIRLTRNLVKLLAGRTRDGYVFRTDLRLRPDPGATQLAISIAAAAQYYLTIGQNWERAAMIRARPIAGDLALGASFLKELQPFIWRKYLDFAAIKDVHAMKRQINAHKGFGGIAVLDHNLKLGRGGIREIEFFIQTQQLIAGGRQPELRKVRTLDALDALARSKWIEERTRRELAEAYVFLRMVEHRIQMQRDEQTHKMPASEAALAVLAAFCGFADTGEFSALLMHHLENVQRHYAALFEETPELTTEKGSLVFVGSEDDPDTLETLRIMGYPDPALVSSQIRQWHAGRFPAMRSEKARERLTEIIPFML